MTRRSDPTILQTTRREAVFELNPYWNVYSSLILIAARLYKGELSPASISRFRGVILQELLDSRQRLSSLGHRADDIDKAEYAVVATLNEAARQPFNAWRGEWDLNPLPLPLRSGGQMGQAGHQFYQILGTIQGAELRGVQSVFNLCLMAGFQGQMGDRPSNLSALRERLTLDLAHDASPDLLFPRWPELPSVTHKRTSSDNFRIQLITISVGALMLFVIVLAWVTWSAGVLVEDLNLRPGELQSQQGKAHE